MIPRTLHQTWVGPLPPPRALMDTWRDLNPTWSYVVWRDAKRMIGEGRDAAGVAFQLGDGSPWPNQGAIDRMEEWGGKTDLMRLAILDAFGGVYVDADARALRPLDDEVLDHEVWAVYENETCRPGVITPAFLGSVQNSSLMRELVAKVGQRDMREVAWKSVGPSFLTEIARSHPELHVYPSSAWTGAHYDGTPAVGDSRPYSEHLFGNTTGKLYERAPGIACVIPCFGQARFLREAVESVLAQTVAVDEIVIVAGDEESAEVANAITNRKVYLMTGYDRGVAEARNEGILFAKGATLFCLDADDALDPKWLETLLPYAMGPRFVVGSDMQRFGDNDTVYRFPKPVNKLLNENTISACALFSRDLWQAVGGYDVGLLGAEDWDFWVRCAQKKARITMVEEALLRYRVHGEQTMERDRRAGLTVLWRAVVFAKNADIYVNATLQAGSATVIRNMSASVRDRFAERARAFPESPTLARIREILDAPTAPTLPPSGLHPEEESALWRPDIVGLNSGGILTYFRRVAPTLPTGALCVQVGLYRGRSFLYLAEVLHRLGNVTAKLGGCDPFQYYPGSFEAIQANAEKVIGARMPAGPSVAIDPVPSAISASKVEAASLSFVFLDGDHSEEGVLADLAAWVPKVRPTDAELGVGGIIAGHDLSPDHPGVERALTKFFGPGRVRYEGETVWSVQL